MSEVKFDQDELRYLQNLLDGEREGWFNYYMETLHDETLQSSEAHANYLIAKRVRDKVYHLGGRDTLALSPRGEYHEQRWDQQHDW